MCGITNSAWLTKRGQKFFQAEDEIDLTPHESLFSGRSDAADRDRSEMDDESKLRSVAYLGFSQRRNDSGYMIRDAGFVAPIGEDTVAQIFVHRAAMLFD